MGGVLKRISGPGTEYSAVRAIDVTTGQVRWEYKVGVPSMAGVTSTASGVLSQAARKASSMRSKPEQGRSLDHQHRRKHLRRRRDDLHPRWPPVGVDSVWP